MLYVFISIRQTGSNINNHSNRKLNYKQLIKYYKLAKPFAVEIYRNTKNNLSRKKTF